MLPDGKVLLIANPTSQSGSGLQASEEAAEHLRRMLGPEGVDVVLTEYAGHGALLAKDADPKYATVVALGGDGVIHEVVNGLMARPADDRPVLGIIPVGSGNDYARSLKVPTDVRAACEIVARGSMMQVDVGKVNEHYFMETLSFGLDAAIALDTVERRKKSGESGTILYLKSGLDQLFHHLDLYEYEAQLDGGEAEDGLAYMVAVQIGPTYGGGFRVCPDAQLDDGLFDVCITHPPLSVPFATLVFLLAKDGHHTGFKQIDMRRAESLTLRFSGPIAAQMDGEEIRADEYRISMFPKALTVVVGK